MVGRCWNCRYWRLLTKEDAPGRTWGICRAVGDDDALLAEHFPYGSLASIHDPTLMDIEPLMATLQTSESFGCVQWKASE